MTYPQVPDVATEVAPESVVASLNDPVVMGLVAANAWPAPMTSVPRTAAAKHTEARRGSRQPAADRSQRQKPPHRKGLRIGQIRGDY